MLGAAITSMLVLINKLIPLGGYPIFFTIAIGFAAYFFGDGPAIFAFILGLLTFDYFFIPPVHEFVIATTPSGIASLIAYFVGSLIVGPSMSFLRKSGEKLREGRARLEAAMDSMTDAVFISDAQGRFTDFNEAFAKFQRSSTKEEVANSVSKASQIIEEFFPDGTPCPVDMWAVPRALRGQTATDVEYIVRRKDTGETWVGSYNFAPIRDRDGRIVGSVVVARDITEQKRTQEELKKQAATLQEQAQIVDLGRFMILDTEGRIKLWTSGDEQLYGYSKDEAIGRISHDLLKAIYPEPLAEIEKTVQRTGQWSGELTHTRHDGVKIAVNSRWVLYRDAEGNAAGILENNSDITQLKHAEAEINKLNETLEQRVAQRTAQLEEANKELESFSYSVSHDLRAPLRAIDGFSNAVLRLYHDQLDERGQDYLSRIRAAAQRMAALIDDILGLSRATRMEMRRTDVHLSAMARDIAEEFQHSEPNRKVEFDIQPNIIANADAHLIEIVMRNLLGNAWKFTSTRDTALIKFGEYDQDGERVYYVTDNGVGFDPEYAGKLFSPFQRLHTEEEFPGTGIGLALVQRIIRKHEGRVWAEGAIDKGATFYFTLG
jgi:PAS domain S-box-containing protein